MTTPPQLSEERTVHIYGGTGGSGGPSNNQGGPGGVGEGPTLNIDSANVHVQGGEIVIRHRDTIINWLSPINFFLRQADISQTRAKGTGGWLLANPVFEKWESASGRTLWCCGIPGAGKTVLASMVVDHLSAKYRNNKDIGVACIYLNHKEADQQLPPKLLAGLWRQLVLNRDIGSDAKELYQQHREKGTSPSLEEVVNVLNASITEFSKVFIIVDAMDEYPEFEREILLQHLAEMASNVNILIMSRPNISPETSSFPNLQRLDIQAVPEDIQGYIDAQINLSPQLRRHIQKQPILRQEIYSKITSTVDGMFLLAKLHIQSLTKKKSPGAVRDALGELPRSLYESYDIAMQRIESQDEDNRKIAHSTLIWVANAKRSLKISEIEAALAIKPGDRSLNKDYLLDIETILSVCAGLVMVDKYSVVRLVHYTTQEYLDKIQAEKFPDAQTEITRTLLTFLAFDGFPKSSWTNSWNQPPLVEYSQYCLAHAVGQPEVQLREILLKFLEKALYWKQAVQRWQYHPWGYSDWPSHPSALWIAAAANLVETTKFLLKETPLVQHLKNPGIVVAAYYGHTEIVSTLLEKGADVNEAGRRYGSALQVAAIEGHTEIIGTLLEKGANVNATGGFYRSTLQIAADKGYTEIVHALLEKGADVNQAGGSYRSALQAAAAGGHTEIVHALLETGADVNAAGVKYQSALQAAVDKGHTEIVHALLKKGANVNAAGGRYQSALQAAVDKGHIEIVDALLEKGADVNEAGGRYESALQVAAFKGHTEIIGALLKKGANVNAAGGFYRSALQIAADKGYTEIVSALLEKGADVNEAGGLYMSALQIAADKGHTEIVHALLEKGADINKAGGLYRSALQAAAAGGHTEIVHALLEMGADVNAAGGRYQSALQAAVDKGHTEIVDALLRKGANVNAAGGRYESALQAAVAGGHAEIVGALLKKGADVNAVKGRYEGALQVAVIKGHTEIVGALLEKGADVHVAGGFYKSALQAAAAGGRTEIVHALLEKGADFNAAGGFYGSALQAAVVEGHTEIVHALLEKGANVNTEGGSYGSALQAAANRGHTEIVNALLEKGANVNAAAGFCGSALQAAANRGHTEIVDILLEKGANVNAARGRYGSALQIAVDKGHTDIVNMLLARGARSAVPE